MDYEHVYYVTDNRNAPIVREHRPAGAGGGSVPMRTPGGTTPTIVGAWNQPAVQYQPPAQYQYPQPNYPPSYPPNYPPNYPQANYYGSAIQWPGYPMQPPYVLPPVAPPSNIASILGGFGNVGSLANIIAQVFAALIPLPAAPTPQDGGNESDPATNAQVNSSNLIRYQSALALFARRDQQILTLGSVLKELFRRPGMVIG